MRCKPGDLAIVTGPTITPGLRFRFVIVESEAKDGDDVVPGGRLGFGALAWWCRPAAGGTLPCLLLTTSGTNLGMTELPRRPIADAILRPIRPNDGVDESLTWSIKELQHG